MKLNELFEAEVVDFKPKRTESLVPLIMTLSPTYSRYTPRKISNQISIPSDEVERGVYIREVEAVDILSLYPQYAMSMKQAVAAIKKLNYTNLDISHSDHVDIDYAKLYIEEFMENPSEWTKVL